MMEKVSRIAGTAAPLMVANISTDVISPGSVMTSPKADFAKGLFAPWRYDAEGNENPAFMLNETRYRGARILVAGKNFGCGSSREAAVWCLQRYGIGCVIAPSFASIFQENAFKNGLVAIALPEAEVRELARVLAQANAPALDVDIAARTISGVGVGKGGTIGFALDEARRVALLEGLDEVDLMLRDAAAIDDFQARMRREQPWLFAAAAILRAQS
jgi:3-isopropylmalate/(R)-2-methylmalate dehydratase small subunit